MTYIRAWMSLKFGQNRPWTAEVVLDGILFILTGNDEIHKSLDEFEIQPDPTTDHRASCP